MTTDGESFSVVDVSGVESAEAIVERVFAKVSERIQVSHIFTIWVKR